MTTNPDVIIIGGGLAGLAAAIHLSKKGLRVTVIEKSGYPRHKVCGEYISNEILLYLKWLELDIFQLRPTNITQFEFSTVSSTSISAILPLGGFGISRYALDDFLYQKALSNGCNFVQDTVTDIHYQNNIFTVKTKEQTFISAIAIGAYGKRSNIDTLLSRNFMQKKSPWLAVKAHYSGNYPDNLVGLHNFDGGYCGVSKVEGNKINICYLANYKTFKRYKNIDEYQQQVLYKNKYLKSVFGRSELLFDIPLTISQVSFDKKKPIENHILMIGDTAGLIHPLCGNGMAMAIHSAKIVSEVVLDYYSGKITSRETMEKHYSTLWNKEFGKRLFMGRMLGKALESRIISQLMLKVMMNFPSLLPKIIKQTHGNPIVIS